ncbi:hypothetical protein MRQ36_25055 [Micromonospora sp. R77]|uniref:hypothetical protein n=1 Tax=Micromonospora sp. R77 TaxID=2925836 RepID=UPI001F6236FC|nr:hypothetical protein [Micromonospora sp. R77]MCI4065650.1 hypothetical protein [Micromonospora sp. R77]
MARRKGSLIQVLVGFGLAAVAIIALLGGDLSEGGHTVALIVLALGIGVGSIGIGRSLSKR